MNRFPFPRGSAWLGVPAIVLAAASGAAGPSATAAQTLFASDPAASASFGGYTDQNQCIAVAGDTAVVCAPYSGAYVFRRSAGAWTEEAKIPVPAAAEFSQFGRATSVYGSTVAVSAPFQDGTGAVYVFVREGSVWSQQAALQVADGSGFGATLALERDRLVIGAPRSDSSRGAVYTFVRSGTTWTQESRLTATDGASGDTFGSALAMDGDTLAVGSVFHGGQRGAVYVYTRNGAAWTEQAQVTGAGTEPGAWVGWAVALSGDTLVASSPSFFLDDRRLREGAAFVFSRTGTTWTGEARLIATDPQNQANYGIAVATDGDVVAVGANQVDGLVENQGATYLYRRGASGWDTGEKLNRPAGATYDQEGTGLAVRHGQLFVGACQADAPGTANCGAVTVYSVGNAQSVLPSAVRLRPNAARPSKSKLTASGTLNGASEALDWTGPLSVTAGGLSFDVPGLAAPKRGSAYSYDGAGLSLKITPAKGGSSRAKFAFTYTGDPGAAVAADGPLVLRFDSAGFSAGATVTLAGGRFAAKRTALEDGSADFTLASLAATLKGPGKDSLKLVAAFPSDGVAPDAAPDVSLDFAGLALDLPGSTEGFARKGDTWTFRGDVSGVTSVVVNYEKGTVTVQGSNLSLGEFADGAVPVSVSLLVGPLAADMGAVAVRSKKSLKY